MSNTFTFTDPETKIKLAVGYNYTPGVDYPDHENFKPPDAPELELTSIRLYGDLNGQLLGLLERHAPVLFEAIEQAVHRREGTAGW